MWVSIQKIKIINIRNLWDQQNPYGIMIPYKTKIHSSECPVGFMTADSAQHRGVARPPEGTCCRWVCDRWGEGRGGRAKLPGCKPCYPRANQPILCLQSYPSLEPWQCTVRSIHLPWESLNQKHRHNSEASWAQSLARVFEQINSTRFLNSKVQVRSEYRDFPGDTPNLQKCKFSN